MRKLVELDEVTWHFKEIDPKKLQRVGHIFRDWLFQIDPAQDKFGFLKQDLPLVEAALSGQLELPYRGYRPHGWELGEGLLSMEYREISAPFYNAIRGAHLGVPKIIEKDGRRYAWLEFED